MGPNEVIIFGLTAIALLLAGIVFARAPRVSNLPTRPSGVGYSQSLRLSFFLQEQRLQSLQECRMPAFELVKRTSTEAPWTERSH